MKKFTSVEVLKKLHRLQDDLTAKDERIKELEAGLKGCYSALDSAWAAIWDGYYGKGLTLEATQANDEEIRAARDKAAELLEGE